MLIDLFNKIRQINFDGSPEKGNLGDYSSLPLKDKLNFGDIDAIGTASYKDLTNISDVEFSQFDKGTQDELKKRADELRKNPELQNQSFGTEVPSDAVINLREAASSVLPTEKLTGNASDSSSIGSSSAQEGQKISYDEAVKSGVFQALQPENGLNSPSSAEDDDKTIAENIIKWKNGERPPFYRNTTPDMDVLMRFRKSMKDMIGAERTERFKILINKGKTGGNLTEDEKNELVDISHEFGEKTEEFLQTLRDNMDKDSGQKSTSEAKDNSTADPVDDKAGKVAETPVQPAESAKNSNDTSNIEKFAQAVAQGIIEISDIPPTIRVNVEESLKNGALKGIYEIAKLPATIAQKVRELKGISPSGKPPSGGGNNPPSGVNPPKGPDVPEEPNSENEIKDILKDLKVNVEKGGNRIPSFEELGKRIIESQSYKDLALPIRASFEVRMKFQAEYFNQQTNDDKVKAAEAKAETNLERWKAFQNQAKLFAKRIGYLLPAAFLVVSGLPVGFLPIAGATAGGLLYGRMNISDKELQLEIQKSKRKVEESKSKMIEIKAQRQNRSDSVLTSYVRTMALVSANQRGEDQEAAVKKAMNSTGVGILPLVR